jgi:ubiquinone/menaquinone biosynthesis C-methylase UbiE
MSFDAKARDWDKDPAKVERAILFAAEIEKIIGKNTGGKALEFGSGTGLVSFAARNLFGTITLADTSAGMMEVLREKIEAFGDGEMTPVHIKSTSAIKSLGEFDAVYTLLTLHHVDDLHEAYSSFAAVLKMGGLLFIGDLITEDGSFHRSDPSFGGHLGFDPSEMKRDIEEYGFKTAEMKIFSSVIRDLPEGKREYPMFLLAMKKT